MNATEWEDSRKEVLVHIGKLLHCYRTDQALGVRKRVTTQRKGYRIEKLEFMSEPGIYIPAWVFVPGAIRTDKTPLLYVSDGGKEAEGMEFGVLENLTLKGNLVVAVDVRGIGETATPHDPQIRGGGEFSHLFDVETAFSYMAWWMDQSLLGMRVQDVIRSVDYALSRPDVDKENVRIVGKGMGALWILFAAALDRRIQSAICESSLVSYQCLALVDRYTQGANTFVRDVLLNFDLPDVAACVADRKLVLLAPVDAMGHKVDLSQAKRIYQWTGEAYSAAGNSRHFRIVERQTERKPADEYLYLLQG
jgi:pimeloyl-ACP methyl ester carboxylesterase